MGRILIVGVIAGVIISIGLAFFYYVEFQPTFINVNAGEPVQIGPVRYVIEHIGEHNGDKETRPEHTFFQISILAENLSDEETRMTGGQFYIIDENDVKRQPIYGNFSDLDLFWHYLKPNESTSWTTQFDIPYDESKQYKVGIVPTKEQSSMDIGIVCLTNC